MVKKNINLDEISEEDILGAHICDLSLDIKGTWLEDCIKQLYEELESKGILFKPECYLTDEWLTPEGGTCIGIPFFLAHPALIRLEKKIMIEAEGETKQWCMKLLRHETGHAICYAYKLHRRKLWKKLFGPSTLKYSDSYKFRPYSKNYVRHLDGHYAQYHPDEDFVETFAVWLTPNLDWKTQYKGWKALGKLEYVNKLMRNIQGKMPIYINNSKYWNLSSLRITLKNYYKKKRHSLAEDFPDFHDPFLLKIFSEKNEDNNSCPLANKVIHKYRRNIVKTVSRYSGEKKYIINDLIKNIQRRTKELNLVANDGEPFMVVSLSVYITSLIMNYVYTGHLRGKKKKEK